LADDLHALERLVAAMINLVDEQLADATNALLYPNPARSQTVAENDEQVDRMELKLNRCCEDLLERHTPTGHALRRILTALRVNTDLERIGDQCRNLAYAAPHLEASAPDRLSALVQMADLARAMLHQAHQALHQRDRLLARKVIARDLQVNRIHSSMLDEMAQSDTLSPVDAETLVHLLTATKALERIADHIKNIAGHVIFCIEGTNARRSRVATPRPSDTSA
jgi:phosphate transport system protein